MPKRRRVRSSDRRVRKLDALSESRVPEIGMPGLMSGVWKRGTPVLPRQISTLPPLAGKDAVYVGFVLEQA